LQNALNFIYNEIEIKFFINIGQNIFSYNRSFAQFNINTDNTENTNNIQITKIINLINIVLQDQFSYCTYDNQVLKQVIIA